MKLDVAVKIIAERGGRVTPAHLNRRYNVTTPDGNRHVLQTVKQVVDIAAAVERAALGTSLRQKATEFEK
jgi:hypothetical protein